MKTIHIENKRKCKANGRLLVKLDDMQHRVLWNGNVREGVQILTTTTPRKQLNLERI